MEIYFHISWKFIIFAVLKIFSKLHNFLNNKKNYTKNEEFKKCRYKIKINELIAV